MTTRSSLCWRRAGPGATRSRWPSISIPRATWHDGVPVTARDVLFTFERARNPEIAPRLAKLLRRVVSVTAEGDRCVVFRFSQPYAEQLYDAVWHVAPLPAHLLDRHPAGGAGQIRLRDAIPWADGPYRWVRSVAGQFIELAANDRFFLGAAGDQPGASSASRPIRSARINLC